jgi:hypothetical protein
MHDVVPAVGQEVTCVPFQLTLLPLVTLLLVLLGVPKDVGVVPSREMMNPWQYPPDPGLVEVPAAGIGP